MRESRSTEPRAADASAPEPPTDDSSTDDSSTEESSTEESPGLPGGLDAVVALAEPTRRAVYDHLVAAGAWVSRDQAAAAMGLGRATVAHHLDRLADDGLVDVEYRRLTGRSGPGAGRPAKLYRRSGREVGVSLPPRDYELAGSLLADAIALSLATGADVADALGEVARRAGREVADGARDRVRGGAGSDGADVASDDDGGAAAGDGAGDGDAVDRRRAVLAVLRRHGYEPRVGEDGTILLANCPFHRLARRHTELVCSMNLDLLGAAIDAVGGTGLVPRLDPAEGRCCVTLQPER